MPLKGVINMLVDDRIRLRRRVMSPRLMFVDTKLRPSPNEFRAQGNGERMNTVEFRARTEQLGMPFENVARALCKNPSTIRDWASGKKPIPYDIKSKLAAIRNDTNDAIEKVKAALPNYVDLSDLERKYGSRWRRVVTVRAADAVGYTGDLTQALTPPEK